MMPGRNTMPQHISNAYQQLLTLLLQQQGYSAFPAAEESVRPIRASQASTWPAARGSQSGC